MALFRISKKKMIDGVNQNITDLKMELDEYFYEIPDHPNKQSNMDLMNDRLKKLFRLRKDIEELIL